MEEITTGVPQPDEGTRPSTSILAEREVSRPLKFTEPDTGFGSPLVASVVANTPQEVQRTEAVDLGETANPTPDVAAPKGPITEAQYRKMRGQYFTVRHIPLTDCGHKMDVINEPRHRNCENCFFQWMNFHPQLVQTVDEAWREHGQAFVIKLRGRWFAKMFGRYMATVIAFKKQEEAEHENRSIGGITEEGTVGGDIGAIGTALEGGQAESAPVSPEESQ